MSATGYRILGFMVWRGAKWYARRNVTKALPSGRAAGAAGAVVGVVALVAILAGRRASG